MAFFSMHSIRKVYVLIVPSDAWSVSLSLVTSVVPEVESEVLKETKELGVAN